MGESLFMMKTKKAAASVNEWITKLEISDPSFWNHFSIFSDCSLTLETGISSVETTIDLSCAHLSDNHTLALPCSGLSLDIHEFDQVYATGGNRLGEDHDTLKLISKSGHLHVSLSPIRKEELTRLDQFIGAHAEDIIPETAWCELGKKPHLPPVCPCCEEAGEMRVRSLGSNPLTTILSHSAAEQLALIVSLNGFGGALTIPHSPSTLLASGDWLISESRRDRIRWNIRYLHAFRVEPIYLEGSSHHALILMNSHGQEVGSLAAPSDKVAVTWRSILERSHHLYQMREA